MSDPSDETLAARVMRDPAAFDTLMQRYEAPLLRYIRRLTNVATEDAEDILQDAFLKAYTNIASFNASLKFSSWLYRITHNATISAHRKWLLRATEPIDIDEKTTNRFVADCDLPRETERTLLREQVQTLLNQLPLKEREPLELFYFEDKTVQEISDILQKPMGTVATLMRRGKERLKKAYEQLFNLSSRDRARDEKMSKNDSHGSRGLTMTKTTSSTTNQKP